MAMIRGTALSGFDDLVTDLGGDAVALATSAGMAFATLGDEASHICLENGLYTLEETARRLGAADFGLRLGARRSVDILGALGDAARTAPTVRDAFDVFELFMAEYSPAISARMVAVPGTDLCRFEYEFVLDDTGTEQTQAIELSLADALGVLRTLLGSGYRPIAVLVPHPPISARRHYERYFGCRAVFCEPVSGFLVRASDLARPLVADPEIHHASVDHLHRSVGERPTPARQVVRSTVRSSLATGAVGLPAVAGRLGLHPKTLQRRLAAEGVTFADLIDGVRRESAHRLLVGTELGLSEVSRRLGYAEQSVLTRSCNRWFGMPPAVYRAVHPDWIPLAAR